MDIWENLNAYDYSRFDALLTHIKGFPLKYRKKIIGDHWVGILNGMGTFVFENDSTSERMEINYYETDSKEEQIMKNSVEKILFTIYDLADKAYKNW
jgi:hypothetical protein